VPIPPSPEGAQDEFTRMGKMKGFIIPGQLDSTKSGTCKNFRYG
jgi:hypothetical protein